MPETNPQLPTADQAHACLMQRVYAPVFFQKLASAGFPVRNEKEAEDLLTMAAQLRAAEAQAGPSVKQANDSAYAKVRSDLGNVLGQFGLSKAAEEAEAASLLQTADALAASDADVYNSVLALKAAEADYVEQQLNGQPA